MTKKICILYTALLVVVLLRPAELIEAKQRPLPKKIVLNVKSIKMHVGDTNMLTVKSVKPRKASKNVKWNSKNKKIASVTRKGKVEAKKAGTTIIIAQSVKNKKIKAKVKVIVKEKNINLPEPTSQPPVQPQQEQSSQQKEPEQPQNQIQQNEQKTEDKLEKECNYTAGTYRDISWTEASGDGSFFKDAYTILFGEDARKKNEQENSCIINTQEEWTALATQLQEVKAASGTDFVKRYFNDYENTDFTKQSLVVLPFTTQPYYNEHKVTSVRTKLDENGKLCGEIVVECKDASEPDMSYPAVMDECLCIIQLEKSDAEMIDYYVIKEKIGAKVCPFQGNVYPEDGNDFSKVYGVLEKKIDSQSEFSVIDTEEAWMSIISEVKAAVGEEAAEAYFKAYEDTDFDRKSIILHKLPTNTYYGGYKVAGLETRLDEQGRCHGQITIEREDLKKKYPDVKFTDDMVDRMVFLQLNKSDAEMIDTFDLILKTVEVVEKVEKDCTFQASAYYLEQ